MNELTTEQQLKLLDNMRKVLSRAVKDGIHDPSKRGVPLDFDERVLDFPAGRSMAILTFPSTFDFIQNPTREDCANALQGASHVMRGWLRPDNNPILAMKNPTKEAILTAVGMGYDCYNLAPDLISNQEIHQIQQANVSHMFDMQKDIQEHQALYGSIPERSKEVQLYREEVSRKPEYQSFGIFDYDYGLPIPQLGQPVALSLDKIRPGQPILTCNNADMRNSDVYKTSNVINLYVDGDGDVIVETIHSRYRIPVNTIKGGLENIEKTLEKWEEKSKHPEQYEHETIRGNGLFHAIATKDAKTGEDKWHFTDRKVEEIEIGKPIVILVENENGKLEYKKTTPVKEAYAAHGHLYIVTNNHTYKIPEDKVHGDIERFRIKQQDINTRTQSKEQLKPSLDKKDHKNIGFDTI